MPYLQPQHVWATGCAHTSLPATVLPRLDSHTTALFMCTSTCIPRPQPLRMCRQSLTASFVCFDDVFRDRPGAVPLHRTVPAL